MYVAVDKSGDLYIADTENHRIRKVIKTTGIITTIAGTGQAGYNGDDMAATSAFLFYPTAVAVDLIGDVYIADTYNNRLRIVSKKTGIITTVAGNGSFAFFGDNMQSTLSAIVRPFGVAIDASRNIYITDSGNYRIRMVNITTGIITTIAGNGINGFTGDNVLATTTGLSFASGICFDTAGNLFIADYYNNRIRMVNKNTSIITTVAGTGMKGFNGDYIPATSAYLNFPADIAVDALGNLYIADTFNFRIRMVTKTTGIITTIVGTGSRGSNINGIRATSANLSESYGVALTPLGDLYIAVTDKSTIKNVKLWNPTAMPSAVPTSMPSAAPTSMLSVAPTSMPSIAPTSMPSAVPTSMPIIAPTSTPSAKPTSKPSAVPTSKPSAVPTFILSRLVSFFPTAEPSKYLSKKPHCRSENGKNKPNYDSVPSKCPTNKPTSSSSKQKSSWKY